MLRIDLDAGTYTVPYGSYLQGLCIPIRGDYEAVLKEGLKTHIMPDDQADLYDAVNLRQLSAAFDAGRDKIAREYRIQLEGHEGPQWRQAICRFFRQGRSRLCYATITDVTELRRQRDQGRLGGLYTLFNRHVPDEVYEVNLQKGRYRILRTSKEFVPIPVEGTLKNLKGFLAEKIIHPNDVESFKASFTDPSNVNVTPEEICFRALWTDGGYHKVRVNVVPLEEPGAPLLVRIAGAAQEETVDAKVADEMQQLRLMGERSRIVMEQTRCVSFDWEADGKTHYAPHLAQLLSCRSSQNGSVPDMLRSLCVHPEDKTLFSIFHASLRHREKAEATVRLRGRGGRFIWCRIAVWVRRDAAGHFQRAIGTIMDVDAMTRAMLQLRYQAEHDPVTGYSTFAKFKEDATALLEARGKRMYSLWYCDIRNFKFINDIYGYDMGDALLNYWAEIIDGSARPGEAFSRISGDNFVLLRSYTDLDDLKVRFRRCAELLSRFEGLANRRFRVEMIAGLYLVEPSEDAMRLDDMIDRANIAQKSVKALNGSRYALYSEEMRRRVHFEKEIEGCMEEALRHREFCVYLQPQVDIETDKGLFGAEVLVRWNRPGYGTVSPGKFIPLFERNGFIVELDAFVFEEACAYIASRRARGLPRLRLSVNVSRLSLAQGDFLDRYSAIRKRYDVSDGLLELECTETMVIRNFEMFRELLESLPARGFRSAMDDFGTGYSSLNMLKEIMLDVLKLDIAFFRDTAGTPRERAVIESIVNMARALGMATVAEGVEKTEQVEFLRSIGCNAVQGYVFSPPVPPAKFESVEHSFLHAQTARHQ